MNELERLITKINDLYRYSLTKDIVLKEYRWNKWVKIVNEEQKRYLSCGQAMEKVSRIINSRVENYRIFEKNQLIELKNKVFQDQIDQEEKKFQEKVFENEA